MNGKILMDADCMVSASSPCHGTRLPFVVSNDSETWMTEGEKRGEEGCCLETRCISLLLFFPLVAAVEMKSVGFGSWGNTSVSFNKLYDKYYMCLDWKGLYLHKYCKLRKNVFRVLMLHGRFWKKSRYVKSKNQCCFLDYTIFLSSLVAYCIFLKTWIVHWLDWRSVSFYRIDVTAWNGQFSQ